MKTIYAFLKSVGQARAAAYYARMGNRKAAYDIMMTK